MERPPWNGRAQLEASLPGSWRARAEHLAAKRERKARLVERPPWNGRAKRDKKEAHELPSLPTLSNACEVKPVRMSLLRSSPRSRAIIRRKEIALAAESDQIKAYLRGSWRTLHGMVERSSKQACRLKETSSSAHGDKLIRKLRLFISF